MSTRRLIVLALTALLALVIGLLTLLPLPVSAAVPGSDKHHHVIAFAALILPAASVAPRLLWGLLPAFAAYGVLIEVLQPFVGRHGDPRDWFADGLGLLLGSGFGVGLHFLLRRLWRQKRVEPRPSSPILSQ